MGLTRQNAVIKGGISSEGIKMFDVTIYFQFPAWNEKGGITYADIRAKSKSDAIKIARNMAYRDGIAGFGGKGRTTFVATVTQ